MLRHTTILLLAAGLVFAGAPGFVQAAEVPHHARKAPKARRAVAAPVEPVSSGINTPSTDFSKIERADQEPSGPNGPTFRPTMGAGGMGLGGAF